MTLLLLIQVKLSIQSLHKRFALKCFVYWCVFLFKGNDDNSNADHDNSSSFMLMAALCSSIMGLFMLIYVAIWSFKQYNRRGYETINDSNGCCKNKNKLAMCKRISLRNLGGNTEKSIMYPSSASYTFDDEWKDFC